jgi:hypothetical protein
MRERPPSLSKKLYLNDDLRYEHPIDEVIHFELVKDFPR